MRRRWSKEKALFAIALVLFAWTAAKLGILLTHREAASAPPTVVAPVIHHGDPRLGDFLRPPAFDAALGRGSEQPFGRGARKEPPPPPDDPAKVAEQPGAGGDGEELGNHEEDPENLDEDVAKDDHDGDGGKRAQGAFPPPPPPPSLTLVAVVRTDGQQPRTQAVVRNDRSGQLLRLSVGDCVLDDLRLDIITDDSVTLVGAGGRRHVLRGRFETLYGH